MLHLSTTQFTGNSLMVYQSILPESLHFLDCRFLLAFHYLCMERQSKGKVTNMSQLSAIFLIYCGSDKYSVYMYKFINPETIYKKQVNTTSTDLHKFPNDKPIINIKNTQSL